MTVEADLVTHLKAHTGVAALVGDRIEPLVLTNPRPAIVYQLISEVDGLAVGLLKDRYRFTCWADTYPGAKAVAAQVRAAFDRYHGTIGSTHAFSRVVSNRDDRDPETGLPWVALEVLITYQN